jgi:hypothetical protein
MALYGHVVGAPGGGGLNYIPWLRVTEEYIPIYFVEVLYSGYHGPPVTAQQPGRDQTHPVAKEMESSTQHLGGPHQS